MSTTPSPRTLEGAAGIAEMLDEDWLDDDWLDDDLADDGPPCEPEWGLPLGAENLATGEPLVNVDYFDLDPAHRTGVARRLLALAGAVPGGDGRRARILVFDTVAHHGAGDPRSLIAIATVGEDDLRVETARSALSNIVRAAVQAALGPGGRYRERRQENPVEVWLAE